MTHSGHHSAGIKRDTLFSLTALAGQLEGPLLFNMSAAIFHLPSRFTHTMTYLPLSITTRGVRA